MLISCVSQKIFESILLQNNLNDNNISEYGMLFISIIGDNEGTKHQLKNNVNVLNLCFNDIEEDMVFPIIGSNETITYKAFTEEQAKQVYEFAKLHKPNIHKYEICLVHCYRGISRSGAIASWLCDYWGLDGKIFKEMNPHIDPNKTVLSILNNFKCQS